MKRKISMFLAAALLVGALAVPVSAAGTYTVAQDDVLWKIAQANGVTWEAIAQANSLANPNLIFPGQQLVIPDAGAPAAPAPAAPAVPAAPPAAPVAPAAPAAPDAVAQASPKETSDPAALKTGLGAGGTWIMSILSDVTITDGINVAGKFWDKDNTAGNVYRKLALYAQDADHNVTANYTLTCPIMSVSSPNFRIQNGKVVGDIYVNAEGFDLNGATVEGNVYFETETQMLSAKRTDSPTTTATVTGEWAVKSSADSYMTVDAVAAATPTETYVVDAASLEKGLGADGTWIINFVNDLDLSGLEFVAEGEIKHDDAVDRKVALYSQGGGRTVTDNFTLKLDKLTVKSPHFRIQYGKIVGDVFVDAPDFELSETIIDGNLYFSTQALLDAFENEGTVTGEIAVMAATLPGAVPAPAAAKAVRTGLGIVTSTAAANTKSATADAAGAVQVDSTVAVVTIDADGIITKCSIDVAQTRVNFDGTGKITSDLAAEVTSKLEKEDGYGMRNASGIESEWFEQADAYANWAIGKTASQVAAMTTKAVNEEHQNVPDVPELAASVTIDVGDFKEAVAKAVTNAKAASATGDYSTGLGIETLINSSTPATETANGKGQVDSTVVAVTVDGNGVIVACSVDVAQTSLAFNATGELQGDKAQEWQSKLELGEGYNMRNASAIKKEWFEQANAFAEWAVGKTAAEVSGLKTVVKDDHHQNVIDPAAEPDLVASVSIDVGDFIGAFNKAVANAK